MIDLHCHILPGLDDGAADLRDSLGMGRQAETNGVTQVCATPHIRHDHDVVIGELADRVARSTSHWARPAAGRRFAPAEKSLSRSSGRSTTTSCGPSRSGVAGAGSCSNPLRAHSRTTSTHTVRQLADRGFRSLIAHPERHLGADLLDRLARLTRAGALVQVTAAALVRSRDRRGHGDPRPCRGPARAGQRLPLVQVRTPGGHHAGAGEAVGVPAARPARGLDRLAGTGGHHLRAGRRSPLPPAGRSRTTGAGGSGRCRDRHPGDDQRLPSGRTCTWSSSSSTTGRNPLPRPCRKKLAAPAAMP